MKRSLFITIALIMGICIIFLFNKSIAGSFQNIPYSAGPHGIFVHAPNLPVNDRIADKIRKYIVNNPTVTGVNIVIPWSAIDNGPNATPQYDWSFVEQAIRPWRETNKAVGFLVWGVAEGIYHQFGGKNMTPQYVLDQVHTIYSSERPKNPRTPVYWEQGYIDN